MPRAEKSKPTGKLTPIGGVMVAIVSTGLIGFGVYKYVLSNQPAGRTPGATSQQTGKQADTNPDSAPDQGTPDSGEQNQIIVNGSTGLLQLVQALKADFVKTHSGTQFVIGYQGTSTGMESLINGSADIASASRAATQAEMAMAKSKGLRLRQYQVAIDAIAIVVNKDNPVSSLSVQQLEDIYTSRVSSWKELGGANLPINALARQKKEGLHDAFKEIVLKGQSYGNQVNYSFDTTSTLQTVIKSQTAIAMAPIAQTVNQSKVKILGIKADDNQPAVTPHIGLNIINYRAIANHIYPLTRGLYLYTSNKSPEIAQQFVNLALSPEGQEIVKNLDLIPAP